jgi:hypothetical protein
MKLFAELYLDEDVSALVATLLRLRGFVTTNSCTFDSHSRQLPNYPTTRRHCPIPIVVL